MNHETHEKHENKYRAACGLAKHLNELEKNWLAVSRPVGAYRARNDKQEY